MGRIIARKFVRLSKTGLLNAMAAQVAVLFGCTAELTAIVNSNLETALAISFDCTSILATFKPLQVAISAILDCAATLTTVKPLQSLAGIAINCTIALTTSKPLQAEVVTNFGCTAELTANSLVTGTIAITEPQSFRTLQRDFATLQADMTVLGSFSVTTGTLGGIEVQWDGGAWVSATVDSGNGTFSVTLPDQATGQGDLRARFANNASVIATNQYVGVGERFGCGHQSNMSGRGDSNQVYTPANGLKATLFGNDYVWKDLTDPYDRNAGQIDSVSSDSANGSYIPLLASYFLQQGIPVEFVPCAKGGTTTTQWLPDTTALPGSLRNRATLFGSALHRCEVSGGIRAFLMHGGESNADQNVSQLNTTNHLKTIAETLKTELGCQTFVVRLQGFTSGGNGIANRARTIAATNDAIDQSTAIEAGPDLGDIVLPETAANDVYHLRLNSTLATVASRWWAYLSNFYSLPGATAIPDITPTGTVDITSPTVGQSFAQGASLSIAGNYNFATGRVTGGIRARFNNSAWTAIAPNLITRSGTYSGSITLPSSNVTGLLEVSFVDNPTVIASVSIVIGSGSTPDTSLEAATSIVFGCSVSLIMPAAELAAATAIVFGCTAVLAGADPDAQAYFDAITANSGTMSTAHKTAFDNYVKAAKTSGTWAAIRVFMPFAGDNIQAAITYLKKPAGVPSSPTHTFASANYAANGLTGGAGLHIDSGINLTALGYNLSNLGFAGWTHTNFTANNQNILGVVNAPTGTNNYTLGPGRYSSGSRLGGAIGGSGTTQFAGTTGWGVNGLLWVNNEGSRQSKFYVGTTLVGTAAAAAAQAPANANLAFMAANAASDNSKINHAPVRTSAIIITEGMTEALLPTFHSELATLMTALGR